MPSRMVNRQKVLSCLVESLKEYDPERLLLYGSWARNEEDEMSDIDLVVVKLTNKPFLERLAEASQYLTKFEKAVDLLIYTPEELVCMKEQGNAFIEMLLEEGRLIYAKQAA